MSRRSSRIKTDAIEAPPVTPRVRKPAARKKAVLSPQDEVVEVDVVYPLNDHDLRDRVVPGGSVTKHFRSVIHHETGEITQVEVEGSPTSTSQSRSSLAFNYDHDNDYEAPAPQAPAASKPEKVAAPVTPRKASTPIVVSLPSQSVSTQNNTHAQQNRGFSWLLVLLLVLLLLALVFFNQSISAPQSLFGDVVVSLAAVQATLAGVDPYVQTSSAAGASGKQLCAALNSLGDAVTGLQSVTDSGLKSSASSTQSALTSENVSDLLTLLDQQHRRVLTLLVSRSHEAALAASRQAALSRSELVKLNATKASSVDEQIQRILSALELAEQQRLADLQSDSAYRQELNASQQEMLSHQRALLAAMLASNSTLRHEVLLVSQGAVATADRASAAVSEVQQQWNTLLVSIREQINVTVNQLTINQKSTVENAKQFAELTQRLDALSLLVANIPTTAAEPSVAPTAATVVSDEKLARQVSAIKATYEREMQELKSHLAAVQASLADAFDADKKHVSANEAIQKQQQALQETQAQSAKTLKDSQSDIKSLSQRQADLEHLLKASSQPQGTQVSTTQIAAVELDLKKLSDAVSQLNKLNIADSFVSTAADLKALHVAMNAVNARLDAVAKEAAAQLAHQKEVDSSIKKLGETESKNHKSSQDSLAQARDELSAQLKKIENQLLEHIKQQNAPKGENVDVEAMRQQIAALQKQWTDNEKKLSSALEGRVAKVEESLLALTSQANLIEERLLAAEKAVFAATSGIQNLESSQKSDRVAASAQAAALKEVRDGLSDLQQSIKSQAQAQTLQNDAKAAQARLQTDGSDSSYAEVARLQQAQIDELKRERDDLKKWVLEQINAASEHALSDHSSEIDYALHSAGGTIVSRSATYRHPQSSFLAHVGAHVVDRLTRRESQHPIQISVLTPGECWPMKGSSGYVSIELSARIRITAAVVEHVSHKIAPHYSSAPRAMRLVGFESSSDAANEGAVGVVLGQFEYQSFGSMIQRFEIASSASSAKPFTAVRLEILSNHGNADYTCLYRVRIHGQPVA